MRAAWRPLLVDGAWNPTLRAQAAAASGVYVVRRKADRVVLYVGESHTGALWKTLIRHFQDWRTLPEHFYDRNGNRRRGAETFMHQRPELLEAAIFVTSTGKRTKAEGDQAAMVMQARMIERYRPQYNEDDGRAEPRQHAQPRGRGKRGAGAELVTDEAVPDVQPITAADVGDELEGGVPWDDSELVDDGGPYEDTSDDPDDPFAARANPAPKGAPRLDVNVPIEKRADMRTPDLFTGRTKLEEREGKGRNDWKGKAEQLERDLAACRASTPVHAPAELEAEPGELETPDPPPAPPRELPAGFGETNERGQARMFNPARSRRSNPLHSVAGVPSFHELTRLWHYRPGEPASNVPGGAYKHENDRDGERIVVTRGHSRRVVAEVYDLDDKNVRKLCKVLAHASSDPYYRNQGEKVLRLAEACPPPPSAKTQPTPWKPAANGTRSAWDVLDWNGRRVLEAKDAELANGIALAVTLAELGELARKLGVTAKTTHPELLMRLVVDERAKVSKKRDALEARIAKGTQKGDADDARGEALAMMRREAYLDLLGETVRAFEENTDAEELGKARAAEAERARLKAERETEDAREAASRVLTDIDPAATLETSPNAGPPFFAHAIRRDGSPIASGKADDQATAYRRLLDALFDVKTAARREVTRAAARARRPAASSASDVLRLVDGTPGHWLGVDAAPFEEDDPSVVALVRSGAVKVQPARGRYPRRYVVTSQGSYERGTFDSDDRSFRQDARDANTDAKRARLAREAEAKKAEAKKAEKAAAAARALPAGYGTEERGKKKVGQLRMFNPSASAPKPSGKLTELGRLTELEWEEPGTRKLAKTRWHFLSAPILAEDKAGHLFVVYSVKPHAKNAKSGARERMRYRVTHWGRAPRGVAVDGSVLQGPHAVVLGVGTRIVYTTQKGRDALPVDYVHAWGEGAPRGTKWRAPVIVAQAQTGPGRRIVALAGGTYRVTSRGIVG